MELREKQPQKVDFYASQLISHEALLGLDETSQKSKNALNS